MSGKQVVAKMIKEGWEINHVSGSHHIMIKSGYPRCVPVPVHGNRSLSRGLISAIQKQLEVTSKIAPVARMGVRL